MTDFKKIIFVSETDTSRGPLAAAITGRALLQTGITVESRGLIVLFPEPMNPKTVAIAASRGIILKDYVSTQLTDEDFGQEVLVLTLDETYKKTVYEEYKNAMNVYTLKEYTGGAGNISDPYGGDLPEYGELYGALEKITDKLTDILMSGREQA